MKKTSVSTNGKRIGRPPGSKNKKHWPALNAREACLARNIDPFDKLAQIAADDKESTPDRIRANAALCSYLQPALKAVENIGGHTGETVTINMDWRAPVDMSQPRPVKQIEGEATETVKVNGPEELPEPRDGFEWEKVDG